MKKRIAKMDLWLLLVMILFTAFGLVMIFSSSSVAAVLRYNVAPSHFFYKQLISAIIAYVVGVILVTKIPTKYYKLIAFPAALLIIALLGGLFVYGKVTNGAQSWYRTKLFAVQPAEFAKSIMIVFVSVYYNKIHLNKKLTSMAHFIPLAISLIFAILIFLQPDLGGAIIVAGIAFLLFLAVPMDKQTKQLVYKVTGTGIVLFSLVVLFSGKTLLNNMQSSRLNFLNPCSRYQEDTGYQVCNGFIAIHNGGLFGVGLGNSTQKYLYLPESHTDFIFPIICEELGAVVGIIVVLVYGLMLYRILIIAKKANNLRNSLLAYGVFLLILSHILVNLMGVLGLIPLTGVPLPFLSYGGSFNVNILIMLFVVQRVAIENKENETRKIIKNI